MKSDKPGQTQKRRRDVLRGLEALTYEDWQKIHDEAEGEDAARDRWIRSTHDNVSTTAKGDKNSTLDQSGD